MTERRALVLGGSGAVGREVVRALRREGLDVTFTFHRSADVARKVSEETGAAARQLDVADSPALRQAIADVSPDIVVHCATLLGPPTLGESTDADWAALSAVNGSAWVAVQAVAEAMAETGGDIVLVGALDRAQSLPLPPLFAATQGMLASLAMAAAKELGPRGVRVNMVALGPLDSGISARLDPQLVEEFRSYSALRRVGTTAEAARAIVWVAMNNSYMNGKVMSVNGGI